MYNCFHTNIGETNLYTMTLRLPDDSSHIPVAPREAA